MKPHLGFGIMRIPYLLNGDIDIVKAKEMIDSYMEGEFCYFDLHPAYMGGKAERVLRSLVTERYQRNCFLVADKMPYYVSEASEYDSLFSDSLQNCGIEYFDYYLLHALSGDVIEKHQRLGGFEFIKQKKKEGKIKHIGFSFHDKPDVLESLLREHPEMEFVQLQINYLDWDNPVICARECYEIARKYEKPIIVMEPVKGGRLANLSKNLDEEIFGSKNILPKLALQFVAALPGVKIVLSGMSEPEHVIENRKSVEGFLDENNKLVELRKRLISYMRDEEGIACTNCHYCERECPQNIAIPEIFSILNSMQHKGNYDKTSVGRHGIFYSSSVAKRGRASECIGCGKCELRCPQKLPIRELLCKAVKAFETKDEENFEIEYKEVFGEKAEIANDMIKKREWNYEVIKKWLCIKLLNHSLEEYFVNQNIHTIAIYGLGTMGELLLRDISAYSQVDVKYGIDINAIKKSYPFDVCSPKDRLEMVDAIIVTATWDFGNIKKYLEQKISVRIISLKDIIDETLRGE